MCIKINLKQTILARLFFFVIYDDKIPFMHLSWGDERLMLPTLRVSAHSGPRRFPGEIQTRFVTIRHAEAEVLMLTVKVETIVKFKTLECRQ